MRSIGGFVFLTIAILLLASVPLVQAQDYQKEIELLEAQRAAAFWEYRYSQERTVRLRDEIDKVSQAIEALKKKQAEAAKPPAEEK